MALLSLACFTARSTELRMPAPIADNPPDSGAISPILATFLPLPPLPDAVGSALR
jgi:hypothetical protein